jgi:hypothetical protein
MKRKFVAVTAISILFIFISFQVRGASAFALPKLETGSLSPGSRGIDVEALQLMLKDAGLYNGPVDGIYGRKTAESSEKCKNTSASIRTGFLCLRPLRLIILS